MNTAVRANEEGLPHNDSGDDERAFVKRMAGLKKENCGSAIWQDVQSQARNERNDHDSIIYPLWFYTTRTMDDGKGHIKFTNKRSHREWCGATAVRILKYHDQIGKPKASILDRLFRWDFREDVKVLKHELLDSDKMVTEIDILLNENRNASVLVFIHGYSTSFDSAAKAAAILGYDLEMCYTVFFSWPTKEEKAGYPADEATIQTVEENLAALLSALSNVVGPEKVHVIAHSMGNRGLLRAIQYMRGWSLNQVLGQVLFMAPDVDRDTFGSLLKGHAFGGPTQVNSTPIAKRLTLYSSNSDKAVGLSRWLHGYPRAGLHNKKEGYMTLDGLDTVLVEVPQKGFVKHWYYFKSPEVLRDMKNLIDNDANPDVRGLQRVGSDQNVWLLN